MATLEQRLDRIEEKLGLDKLVGYTYTISISDGIDDGAFQYKIYGCRGSASINSVARHVAEFLEGQLSKSEFKRNV